MEGKFYRFKNPNHPHTNMAKVNYLLQAGLLLQADLQHLGKLEHDDAHVCTRLCQKRNIYELS